jgi:hypothetical protein
MWVPHNNQYGQQHLKHRQSLRHLVGCNVWNLPPDQGNWPLRCQIVVAALGPTTIDGPQTRDCIYDKKKPDFTIRYVNAQIVEETLMDNLL